MGAGGADVQNAFFLKTHSAEEPDVGRPEVEERFSGPAGGFGEPCGERNGDMYFRYVSPFLFKNTRREASPQEAIPNLRPDLIAGGANAGPERGQDVRRLRAISPAHGSHGFLKDPLLRPPPTAVDGGRSPVFRVHKENGQTVRGPDDEEEPEDIGHQAVALEFSGRCLRQPVDGVRMELAHDHRPEAPGGREGQKIRLAPSGPAEPVDEPGHSRQARDGGIAGRVVGHGQVLPESRSRLKSIDPIPAPAYDEEDMSAKEKAIPVILAFGLILGLQGSVVPGSESRPRARDFGLVIGVLPTGPLNAITDVAGVKVGQVTLIEGKDVRTGVTAVLPHGGNLFQDTVPAGISVANGYGKLTGVTQVEELGTLETPIVLTNTLSVPTAADAVIDWTLGLPGNERVESVNPVVGETNDGWLNDIRGRHVAKAHVLEAIVKASEGPVAEGAVGAGTGTTCFNYKGGIGTASRRLPENRGGWTVGVLVQTNFGGVLTIRGIPFEKRETASEAGSVAPGDGSCMIVVATDAPLDARNLKRLAKRALLGIARTGGYYSNGSGDYAIAFSTAAAVRVSRSSTSPARAVTLLRDESVSPLFQAAAEAAEEAILNSLFKAVRTVGKGGRAAEALPLDRVRDLLK